MNHFFGGVADPLPLHVLRRHSCAAQESMLSLPRCAA
jgi:hypothetical protein